MPDINKLQRAYEAIYLAEMRGEIDRSERNRRVVALRTSPFAEGLSFQERDAIANAAVSSAAEISDEVYFGPSGRWQ